MLTLILRNLFRDKLRLFLTVSGVAVAVISFVLMRTIVLAWYAGSDDNSGNRLIARHEVSINFLLPISYKDQIARVPGVEDVAYATWFQGVYKDRQNFFRRFAISENYFALHPEYIISEQESKNYLRERNSCVIGRDLANLYDLKLGDSITLEGDLYPGTWEFVIRAIYTSKEAAYDEKTMFFHSQYLENRLVQDSPEQAGFIGLYYVKISSADKAAEVSQKVDELFQNTAERTKTETEQAFRQNLISMYSAIINSVEIISYIIMGIVFLVMANTMVMSARERTVEYGIMRTLGFHWPHIAILILGEALLLSLLGAAVGLGLSFYFLDGMAKALSSLLPSLKIALETQLFALATAAGVGVFASIVPIFKAVRVRIVDSLKQVE